MSIFLAHCPADTALANTLVARLRAAGSDVFVEVAAEASEEVAATPLPAREATRRHVLQELIRRPVFVVIVSPAALDSAWVHDLCDWAYDLYQDEPSRMVVAVMLRSAAPTPTPAPQQPFPASSIYAFQRVEAPASDMEHDPEAAALLFERLSGALALLTPPGVASAAGGWENDLSWGMALATQERFAEALPYLQRAARHAPASFDAWFQLGQTLLRLRRDMEAVAALRRATELVPANAYAWNGMGRALLHARRDEEALEAYARALALYPHYTSALIGQGHALRHLGRLDAAMAVYQQVVQANPTEVSAHMGQGAALFAQARYQEAAPACVGSIAVACWYAAAASW